MAVFLWELSANAAVCMKHDQLVDFLAERYGEHPLAMGFVSPQLMMEMFVSEAGTWSVVLTNTQGIACINAAGSAWENVKSPPGPEY